MGLLDPIKDAFGVIKSYVVGDEAPSQIEGIDVTALKLGNPAQLFKCPVCEMPVKSTAAVCPHPKCEKQIIPWSIGRFRKLNVKLANIPNLERDGTSLPISTKNVENYYKKVGHNSFVGIPTSITDQGEAIQWLLENGYFIGEVAEIQKFVHPEPLPNIDPENPTPPLFSLSPSLSVLLLIILTLTILQYPHFTSLIFPAPLLVSRRIPPGSFNYGSKILYKFYHLWFKYKRYRKVALGLVISVIIAILLSPYFPVVVVPGVAYSLVVNRPASDMDGVGTELNTGDTVLTNAFTLTLDTAWTLNACGNITYGYSGDVIEEAGVDVTWDAGTILAGRTSLATNEPAKFDVQGTAASGCTWTPTTTIRVTFDGFNGSGYFNASYLTATGLAQWSMHRFHFISCSLTGRAAGANGMFWTQSNRSPAGNSIYMQNCTVAVDEAFGVFVTNSRCTMDLVAIDTTFTNVHANGEFVSMASNKGDILNTITFAGDTTYNGVAIDPTNGAHYNYPLGAVVAREMGNTWTKFYSRVQTTENVAGFVAFSKADITKQGHVLYPWYLDITKQGHVLYPWYLDGNYTPGAQMNSSLWNYTYVLVSEYNSQDGWVYYSDENQAEANDNSEYTAVGGLDATLLADSETFWGIANGDDYTDGVALNLTLGTAGGGVRVTNTATLTGPT